MLSMILLFLCFGIFAAEQNSKLKVTQHSFPFIFTVNHIDIRYRLGQDKDSNSAFPQLAQTFNNLQFAE